MRIFPNFRGENKKIFETTYRSSVLPSQSGWKDRVDLRQGRDGNAGDAQTSSQKLCVDKKDATSNTRTPGKNSLYGGGSKNRGTQTFPKWMVKIKKWKTPIF